MIEEFQIKEVIMSISLEALAMAGEDYLEWEDEESELPPPHLLVDDDEEAEDFLMSNIKRGVLAIDDRHGNSYGLTDDKIDDEGSRRVLLFCDDHNLEQWRILLETLEKCFRSSIRK